ncbi:MAG: preprotein translocase subunit SecE [Endomicrobium sp.]|jgi:preprotein translocase subunit SecE|nr:preprotein translocase subunit SecE [Endomicrobium sp.]
MKFINTSIQFFKDACYELINSTWLSKKEVLNATAVVVVFVIIMSIFVSVTDMFLGMIVSFIL